MRPATYEQQQDFMTGAQKDLALRFSDGTSLTTKGRGNEISEGTMTLTQTLCDEEQIHFGLCNAASFSVQILASTKRYKGLFVYPTITSGDTSFALGKFRIEDDELTDDRMYRTLTCYDQMTDLMTDDVSDWYAGINLPMTLKQFRNSLFQYFQRKYGVKQAPIKRKGKVVDSLPNDGMMVERTLDFQNQSGDGINYQSDMNGQLMLERICEINGCFGCINEDGDFEYRILEEDDRLYPADDLFPADDLYPVGEGILIGDDPEDVEGAYIQASLVWKEYEYQPITKLQIHQTEHDIGAIVGEDGNCYEVYDNFLVYGMDASHLQTVAENLLAVLKKTISYTPARVAVRGRPWVQTGDLISVVCRGRTISFPLLNRTLSGVTALKDEYEAQGQEYFDFDITETNHEYYGILRKTYELIKNVDGLWSHATEIDDKHNQFESTLWQRAREIGIDVTNGINHATLVALINDIGESQIQIEAQNINLVGYVTFSNLEEEGETVINGSNITTGVIDASLITAGELNASVVKTGLLLPLSGRSYWNLDDGDLFSNRIGAGYAISSSGFTPICDMGVGSTELYSHPGFHFYTTTGVAGYTLGMNGLWLERDDYFNINATGGVEMIHISQSGGASGDGAYGIHVYVPIYVGGEGGSHMQGVTGTYNGVRYINGICVGAA